MAPGHLCCCSCATGYTYVSLTKMCLENCPKGWEVTDSSCIEPCPSGTAKVDATTCIAKKSKALLSRNSKERGKQAASFLFPMTTARNSSPMGCPNGGWRGGHVLRFVMQTHAIVGKGLLCLLCFWLTLSPPPGPIINNLGSSLVAGARNRHEVHFFLGAGYTMWTMSNLKQKCYFCPSGFYQQPSPDYTTVRPLEPPPPSLSLLIGF